MIVYGYTCVVEKSTNNKRTKKSVKMETGKQKHKFHTEDVCGIRTKNDKIGQTTRKLTRNQLSVNYIAHTYRR